MLLVCSYKQTWMAFIHNKLRFFSYSFLLILTMPKINTYLPYIIWILLLGHLWWLQRESHLTNVWFVWNAYSICCVILGWRLLEFVCILVDLLLQRIAFIESQPYDSLYIINVLSTIALLFLGTPTVNGEHAFIWHSNEPTKPSSMECKQWKWK